MIDDENIKITMLGASGVGKTMFLSGLYQSMIENSFEGYRFTANGKDSQTIMNQIGEIGRNSLIERNLEFPLGTDSTKNFKLKLKKYNEDICNVDFIDYKGGFIEELFASDSAEKDKQGKFMESLLKSDVILILVDAVQISKYGDDIAKCQKITKANFINMIFSQISERAENKFLTILFVLTKTDSATIKEYDKANNFEQLINKTLNVYKLTFELIKNQCSKKSNWSFGVVPITAIGENAIEQEVNVKGNKYQDTAIITKMKDVPEPKNIDTVMLYSVAKVLEDWKKVYEFRVRKKKEELSASKEALTNLLEQHNTKLGKVIKLGRKLLNSDKERTFEIKKENYEREINELNRVISRQDRLNSESEKYSKELLNNQKIDENVLYKM